MAGLRWAWLVKFKFKLSIQMKLPIQIVIKHVKYSHGRTWRAVVGHAELCWAMEGPFEPMLDRSRGDIGSILGRLYIDFWLSFSHVLASFCAWVPLPSTPCCCMQGAGGMGAKPLRLKPIGGRMLAMAGHGWPWRN